MFHYDPVCGRRINRNKAHIEIEHNGHTYLLCCPTCQAAFESEPDRYVKKGVKTGRSSRREK